MLRRRRPLLRAAVVGGGAYVAGKRTARRSAEAEQAEAYQDQRISDLEQQQAPAAAPAGGTTATVSDQLQQLAKLHEQGVLTDDEFAASKAKLLGI
jgi:Short C-terminal domain